MPTPGERRALLFIASVAALGVAVRGWRMIHPQNSAPLAGDRAALARQIEAVDSAISTTSSLRMARASRAQSPRIDPAARAPRTQDSRTDPAPRAPRSQARPASPAPRASNSRVRPPMPADTAPRDPRQSYWDRSLYFDSIRQALETDGPPTSARHRRAVGQSPPSAVRRLPSAATQPPLDLDIAGTDEVSAIPLIGPALARRIVADRIENGPFGSISGLERVRGISAALARRLSPFVTFSRSPRLGSAGERPVQAKKSAPPKGALRP